MSDNPLHEAILGQASASPLKLGKVTLSPEAVNTRMNLIDKITGEQRKAAVELLNIVHENFPLDELMPEDFKGSHSLTLRDGKLLLTVWCNGEQYSALFNP